MLAKNMRFLDIQKDEVSTQVMESSESLNAIRWLFVREKSAMKCT